MKFHSAVLATVAFLRVEEILRILICCRVLLPLSKSFILIVVYLICLRSESPNGISFDYSRHVRLSIVSYHLLLRARFPFPAFNYCILCVFSYLLPSPPSQRVLVCSSFTSITEPKETHSHLYLRHWIKYKVINPEITHTHRVNNHRSSNV